MLNDFSIRDFDDWTRVQNREGGERKCEERNLYNLPYYQMSMMLLRKTKGDACTVLNANT